MTFNQTPSARRGGIRNLLLQLVLACLLPALVGFALLFTREYLNGRAQLERDTIALARAMVHAVDSQLLHVQAAGLALSSSELLARRDLASFHQRARNFIDKTKVGVTVVLSDENGQQLLNTFRDFGAPLPRHGNPDLLHRAFSTRQPIVSDIYIGSVLKKPVLSVELPVMDGDKMIYDLSIGLLPSEFDGILAAQNLPPAYLAAIFDSQGTIVARTHAPEKFVGQKGTTEFIQRIQESLEGSTKSVTREGVPTFSVWSRSPVTGWSVGIGIPRQKLEAELTHTLAWLFFGMTFLLVGSVVLAWRAARVIAGSVRALVAPAVALGKGEPVRIPDLAIQESAEVATAIGQAAELLGEREADLREAHRIAKFGFWQWNLKTDEMTVSESIRELCGRDFPSFPKQRGALLPEDSWERLSAARDEAVRTGVGFDLELQVNHGNGSTIWINAKCEAVRDKQREVCRLQGSMQNITRRKQAELALDEARQSYLQQLELQVAERTTALVAANRELERLGWLDSLTGLRNRRSADEQFRQEFLRLKRSGNPYSILFIDIDHFKRVNDTYGHEMGDAVIRLVASKLESLLRESDFIARYGGEEFIVILPNTAAEGALISAEKLRYAVAADAFPTGKPVTISIGVTMALVEDNNEEQAIRRADIALYQAKEAGRNAVRIC